MARRRSQPGGKETQRLSSNSRSTLPTNLRRQLETAIKQARKIADGGARKALEALAVHEPDPYRHMDEGQRDLRRKLRSQAKQLGDGESQSRRGAYEIKHLVEKLAYDQWHRLLFARFLLENNLLISPEHEVSVTLDDCEELAPSLGLKDAWSVAARFAAKELPEIFRADDPAGAVELPVEDRKPLIQLVTGLPVDVFTASDSLGWCYQFWQAERKDEVNAAGDKIGADELPAVTQLFTEDYMVDFLLDNTLRAWHAGKFLAAKPTLAEAAQCEEELRNVLALPGCPWKYLRFTKAKDGKWTPAAGAFDGWPKTANELKCFHPCMGSGHFMVAMFERLVALRMAEKSWVNPSRWWRSSATTCSGWKLTRVAPRSQPSTWPLLLGNSPSFPHNLALNPQPSILNLSDIDACRRSTSLAPAWA